ncbi:MAG: hypothetical protein NC102_05030 [Clostridium sp.]|nr:hypothetical protein [Clostridium sp.]
MNIIRRILIHIPEIHKIIRSLIFCIKYLPFKDAILMPIFLDVPIDVIKLKKGCILFNGGIAHRQVEFVEGINGIHSTPTSIYIEENSKIIFYGKAFISDGCTLRVDEGGVLEIGNNFVTNKNTLIRCSRNIKFLDDVMIGWCNEINDNDGHPIYIEGKRIESKAPIEMGPHVWITSYVRISKGVTIPYGCIIAKGAIVAKKHEIPNSLIGGVPAKEIRQGIDWGR